MGLLLAFAMASISRTQTISLAGKVEFSEGFEPDPFKFAPSKGIRKSADKKLETDPCERDGPIMQLKKLHGADDSPDTGMKEKILELPKCAGELMTTKVVTLYPDRLFREAVDLMAKNSSHHLVVVERNGCLAGIISDRDVLAAANDYASDPTVADIMTSEPQTVSPDTPLSEVATLTLEHRFNCFPVVNHSGKVAGILTTTDLLRAFQKLQHIVESSKKLKAGA